MGIAALIANTILDVLLSHWMGVAGIALASSGAQLASLLVLIVLLRSRAPELFS